MHATFVEKASAPLAALRTNVSRLGAGDVEIVKDDALHFAARLDADQFEVVLADPPYGRGYAAELARLFLERRFGRILAVEHRVDEQLDAPDAHTRRYGDTVLTFLSVEP